MCAGTSQEFQISHLVDSGHAFNAMTLEQADDADERIPAGPDEGHTLSWISHAPAYACSGVALAIALFFAVGMTGLQPSLTSGHLCPIVCLLGLFGPDGSSFIRHWVRKYTKWREKEEVSRDVDRDAEEPSQSGEEPSPAGPGSSAPQETPSCVDDEGEINVLAISEKVPDASRRFDAPVSSSQKERPPSTESRNHIIADHPVKSERPADHPPGNALESERPEGSEAPSTPPMADLPDLLQPAPAPVDDGWSVELPGFDDADAEHPPGIATYDPAPTDLAGDATTPSPPGSASAVIPYEDRPLETLIADLCGDDPGLRERALDTLAERGAPAVAPLIEALSLADDRRRWCVAEALAAIGRDAIPPLIDALRDVTAQAGVAATLVRIGGPAVPALIEVLSDATRDVRFGALYVLREIGDAALPFLVEALDHPDGVIRMHVARVLGDLGWNPPDDTSAIRYLIASEAWLDVAEYGEAAIAPLINLLRSPEREVWWNASRTLGEIGEAAVDPLIDLLSEVEDDEVGSLVSMALAEIGSPAVDPLIPILSDPSLCGRAAETLAAIGGAGVERCILALDSEDGVLCEALQDVLVAIGDPAVPSLIQALSSPNSRVRSHAAEVLERLGWEPWSDTELAWYLIAREQWMELAMLGTPAVEPLIRTLRGDNDRIRSEAAWTLGEIGDQAAVGPLVDALADGGVAQAAAEALVAIGSPSIAPTIRILEEGSGGARENAVEVLGRIRAHEAVPTLVELVRSGDDRLQRKAIDALVSIGSPAVPALLPLLGEEGDGHAGAMDALAGIGDAARGPLLEVLDDENPRTRMSAALVLERTGWMPIRVEERARYLIAMQRWPDVADLGAVAVDLLVARLGDRDPGVQAGAAASLALIGDPAVPPLVSLLGEENLRGPAGAILVEIGDAAVEPLVSALDEDRLRRAAAGVLVRIGRPAAEALIPVLGRPDISREVAEEVLIAIGEPSVEPLITALGDDDTRIRQKARDLLIGLGDLAIRPLIRTIGHPEDLLRLGAIDTLTQASRPAVPALVAALQDDFYRIRLGAAEVLGRVGWVPETEEEMISYLIAKEQWASVAEIGPGAVRPLIRALDDPDSAIQMGAARALGLIGAPAVAELIDALRDGQNGGQRKAIEALKMIGAPAVVPLIDALLDRDWYIRLGAARALVAIGDPAVEPLVHALRKGPALIQMGAAAALGKIGNPAAIDPLAETLLHEDWRVGRVAVRALGMLGEDAVKPLLSVLRDGNDLARNGAVAALVLIGEPAEQLLPGALTDPHFRVRAGAADALDLLNWSPEPGEELVTYLIAKERWSDLLPMGPLAVEPLVRVLQDRDDSIRRRATKVLGKLQDPHAVPALMDLLHDGFYSIRREAAEALVTIGASAMVPVMAALQDEDGDVRKRAAEILAEIGDARAIEPLESILDDDDWYVRRAAVNAMEKIRERLGGEQRQGEEAI